MVEYVLIVLNIEYKIMFDSLVHNFARVLFFAYEHTKRCCDQTYLFYSLER